MIHPDEQLKLNEERARSIESAALCLTLALIAGMVYGGRELYLSLVEAIPQMSALNKTLCATLLGVTTTVCALAALYGMLKATTWLSDRFAPSWLIEQNGRLLKVYGTVPAGMTDKIIPSHYIVLPEAPQIYGCTLAAIPA